MHRSQSDQAHAQADNPSNFVLVLASGRQGSRQGNEILDTDKVGSALTSSKDHINVLGFKNDGYDYSQHLKEMGDGHFIGKDGKFQSLGYVRPGIELPEDALPSADELSRDLNAITISDEVMDDDIRDALFGEDDLFGDFEELQDDFIMEAMKEPEQPDFNFDAHIAALISRSERMAKGVDSKPRGWERKAVDEDDEDDDFSFADSSADAQAGGRAKLNAEQQAIVDAEFDKTLEEYDDDNIGDLEEVFSH
jgi:protein LTV1